MSNDVRSRRRTAEQVTYDFSEQELNGLGYTLLGKGDHAGAIRIFQLNTLQFPTSSNAFDSLGEAFHRAGQRAEAVRSYSRALELDPNNLNAQGMLLKLKIAALAAVSRQRCQGSAYATRASPSV